MLIKVPTNLKAKYIWRAVYQEDGVINENTYLQQFDEQGNEYKYKDIDRWRLGRFDLIDRTTGKVVFSQYLKPHQRLIWRNRNIVKLNGEHFMVTIVGWVRTITTPQGQREIFSLSYLHPDGTISNDDERTNLELLPEEY